MSRARSRRITRSGSWASSCAASPPADPPPADPPPHRTGQRASICGPAELLASDRVRRAHLGAGPAPGACYGTWRRGRKNPPPLGLRAGEGAAPRGSGVPPMATYQMVYGDDENLLTETYEDITGVEREDGWVVLFRGPEAILRVQ